MTAQTFNFKANPTTGNQEAKFMAELVSVSDNQLSNVNGTNYNVCTIRFINAIGQKVDRSAIIYQKNLEHGMAVGTTYLCNITVTPDRPTEPIIAVSHLTNAERATADDFGFSVAAPAVNNAFQTAPAGS